MSTVTRYKIYDTFFASRRWIELSMAWVLFTRHWMKLLKSSRFEECISIYSYVHFSVIIFSPVYVLLGPVLIYLLLNTFTEIVWLCSHSSFNCNLTAHCRPIFYNASFDNPHAISSYNISNFIQNNLIAIVYSNSNWPSLLNICFDSICVYPNHLPHILGHICLHMHSRATIGHLSYGLMCSDCDYERTYDRHSSVL